MADEVVIKSGRSIALGDQFAEVRDDGRPVHFVDVLTEARHHIGVFYLAFGSVIIDANSDQIVQIASRLRMNIATAQDVHRILGQMIDDALKPADKTKAN